ncbi:LADA_0F12860g1_1 [Lachancea dasiensis]|uniref:LADA_0F12860g1_1 n=1 Tax=Lachancea dasiensis TaxID=1072105 RepID=A0A1G4JMP7_9SACH|nr:LADA_0F12860g1_1 [Lachancea dasiensis]
MASVTGSPIKGRSPFIDRYMASLGDNSSEVSNSAAGGLFPNASGRISPAKWRFSSHQHDDKENYSTPKSQKVEFSGKLNQGSPLRTLSPSKLNGSPTKNKDKQSQSVDFNKWSGRDAKYYEFLCRVREAKEWLEAVLSEKLPSELDLASGDSLRNGVYLAQLTKIIDPSLVKKVVPAGTTLQFTHTQNINAFFKIVEKVGVPDLFRFELTDLYEKKDIPKVFETLHALISVINNKWPGKLPQIKNLSGTASFTEEEIKLCQRKVPNVHNFRPFASNDLHEDSSSSKDRTGLGMLSTTDSETQVDKIPKSPALPRTPEKLPEVTNHLESPKFSVTSSYTEKSPDLKLKAANVLANNTPILDFDLSSSPAKSHSYYSPRIYRHLSYRADSRLFSSRRLSDHSFGFDQYDVLKYKTPEYSPVRRKRMTEIEFLDSISYLQAVCRGVNTRFEVTILNRKVDIVIGNIALLQARCRALLKRRQLEKKRSTDILLMQTTGLDQFQSLVKADAVRKEVFSLRLKLLTLEQRISQFQNICYSNLLRRRCASALARDEAVNPTLALLQAIIKGGVQRHMYKAQLDNLAKHVPHIIGLQSLLRSQNLRKMKKSIYFSLSDQSTSLSTAQAISKGVLIRRSLKKVHCELECQNDTIAYIAALMRGSFQRSGIKSLATAVRDSKDPVVSLQGLAKGVLVRFTLELIADIVEDNNLVLVQSLARSSLVRNSNRARRIYYEQSISEVIKIQSEIRRYQLRKAYLEFMSAANPSLWAVRKFVSLLNTIHANDESRSKLESVKSQIDQANKNRDKIQEQLELLGRKTNFLTNYNIFVNTSNSFDPHPLAGMTSFPGYEKLFYLLQTDSFYWKTLYRLDPGFVVKHLPKTFVSANGSMEPRENAFFVRLTANFLASSIEGFKDVHQFLDDGSQSFWKFLVCFYVHRQIPDLLVELFSPLLNYVSSHTVDFESVPALIYKKLNPYDVERSSNEAIEDEVTKEHFIDNLTSLWKATEMVSEALLKNVHRIPNDVKFLCTTAYRAVADRSPYECDALVAISKILVELVLFPFLQSPSKFGLPSVTNEVERKISVLLDVVATVFSFSKFEGYLAPLNQYVEEINDDLAFSLKKMLITPSFEAHCDELIYIDMRQDSRSTLSISKPYLLEIVAKLDHHNDAFPHDDPMASLLRNVKSETELLRLTSVAVVELKLNPSAYHLSSSDDRLTAIYNEIKRGLVYMMQVEEVDTNLYDLMTSSIIQEDEPVFKQLVSGTAAIKSDPLLKNLKPMSYFSLKQHILERAYELKQMDGLGVEDNLQSLLNDIANTIKSREYVVESTEREIRTAERTLQEIKRTNSHLQKKSQELDISQKRALKKIQASNSYVPIKKHGISRKLKDVYNKVNQKGTDGKNCLTLEWTTRRLCEMGALLKLEGENLGQADVTFFGSSGPKFPDVNFKIATSDGECFAIELIDARKHGLGKGMTASDNLKFSTMLDMLAKDEATRLKLFDNSVEFDLTRLLEIIATSFIRRPLATEL